MLLAEAAVLASILRDVEWFHETFLPSPLLVARHQGQFLPYRRSADPNFVGIEPLFFRPRCQWTPQSVGESRA